jgi:hypothetical protein
MSDKPRYPRRERKSPKQAAQEWMLKRKQERAEQQRQQARRKKLAEFMKKRWLSMPPGTVPNASELDNTARNIHQSYYRDAYADQCVTAVVRKHDNTYVVFAQRFSSQMEAYARKHYGDKRWKFKPGGGDHLHAEMYAVLNYLRKGKHPATSIAEIGVSKPICPDCRARLVHLGIVFNEGWTTADSSAHWIDPWRALPDDVEPAVGPPEDDS